MEWAAVHLRVGGVLLADNVFAWGKITNQEFVSTEEEVSVRGLQEFNKKIAENSRFRVTMLPTGEGLTLAVKIN